VSIHNVVLSFFAEALNNGVDTVEGVARKSIIRFVANNLETASQTQIPQEQATSIQLQTMSPTENSSFNPSVLEKLVAFNMCSSAPSPCEA
jgi:hypothetical protein